VRVRAKARHVTDRLMGKESANYPREIGVSEPNHEIISHIKRTEYLDMAEIGIFTDRCAKNLTLPRVLADLHRVAQAMTCDHGRETVVRTGEAPSLGRKADRIALTGEVTGFPRLNRRPYGRGHGAQGHGDSGGNGRGVSLLLYRSP